MESTVKRGPWLEEEFTKEGESYIVNDGYVEGFRASITPREGFFDVEVYRNEHEYERDDEIGVHVVGHREEYLNSRELTVDNIRTAVRDFVTIPDSLANELTEWQEKYWDGNEIEKGYAPEGAEAPEEISERLRLEYGSALAEAQGIAEFAPDNEEVIRRDGYSVYMRDGVPAMYAVNIGLDSRVTIKPTQDGFEVEVTEDGVQHSKSLEESAKDVEKILDLVDISIPYKLVEELSASGREFGQSEEHAGEMNMAVARDNIEPNWDLDDDSMEYERVAKAEAELERSSLGNDRAQEQSVEVEDGEDHSISF